MSKKFWKSVGVILLVILSLAMMADDCSKTDDGTKITINIGPTAIPTVAKRGYDAKDLCINKGW